MEQSKRKGLIQKLVKEHFKKKSPLKRTEEAMKHISKEEIDLLKDKLSKTQGIAELSQAVRVNKRTVHKDMSELEKREYLDMLQAKRSLETEEGLQLTEQILCEYGVSI